MDALHVVKQAIWILLFWHPAHQESGVTLHQEEREALAKPADSLL